MDICISITGKIVVVYNETVDWSALGTASIARASHVEPDATGQWSADLSPVAGPRLGPFKLRSQALAAEEAWLSARLPQLGQST